MLTENDFVTNDWVGCGGLHMVPLIQQVITGYYKPRTLDMGCGCGAIGIALLEQQSIGELVMTDIDKDSIDLALENVKRLVPAPLLASVSCYIADVWEKDGGAELDEAPFDLIVCNAPLNAELVSTPANWNPYRFWSQGGEFQRRLFAGLDKYLSPSGIVIIKDLVQNNWHTAFPAVRLIRTMVGDAPTLQASKEFSNLGSDVVAGQHCLRVFRRAK